MVYLPVCRAKQQLEEEESPENDEISEYEFTASMKVRLESGIQVTVYSAGEERWMRALHEALKLVVGFLQKCELRVFVLKTIALVKYECVLLLKSYCFDIAQAKGMLACGAML